MQASVLMVRISVFTLGEMGTNGGLRPGEQPALIYGDGGFPS